MSRARLLAAVLVVLTVAAIGPPSAAARSLVVDDNDACADARFNTIQAAVDAAAPGDEIPVCPGTYEERVVVQTNGLKIFSRTPLSAVIQKPVDTEPTELHGAVELNSAGTLLRGFTIMGVPAGGECGIPGTGVWIRRRSATVDYNRIVDTDCNSLSTGVFLSSEGVPGGKITVAHNEIFDVGGSGTAGNAGIQVQFGVTVSINSNLIQRVFNTGVSVTDSSEVKVQDNTIEDSANNGIFFSSSNPRISNNRIAGNRVRRNGRGIAMFDGGRGDRIEGNGVFDNAGDGIAVEDTPAYVVRNRSLGNGRFDCFVGGFVGDAASVWTDNIGVTDSPPTLCHPP